MASLGGEQQISSNNQAAEPVQISDSREGSIERKVAHNNKFSAPPPITSQTMENLNASSSSSTLHWFAQVGGGDDDALQVAKDRDEKLKLARERQNEERQRKIEELKAQAEAAQRYREQKEEERRRRIEEIRSRDTEKRHQVEERKRAIMEADKERREYILRKNQERESRLETKKRDRNSYGFAFGSSTPRLLEPDFGSISPSTFWGHRRSTSISNVAGASLSRRSSERELTDSGSKKRATSASGTERHDDHRRKTSSMYEVFNWGYSNDERPKRFSLSIVGSEINIDEPPPPPPPASSSIRTFDNTNHNTAHAHRQYSNHFTATDNNTSTTTTNHITTRYNRSATKEDNVDTSQIVFRSVARRKTDLMPTIPSPRDGHGHHFGSRTSLSNTPRTPVVRAYSMNRLDQLAQPIRRHGEHIRAILERERREQMEMLDETESLGGGRRRAKKNAANASSAGAGGGDLMSRSMTHLAGTSRGKYSLGGGISTNFRPLGSSAAGNRDSTCKSSRSGNVTPGGSINASRPGSAMSTSTTMSTSGLVARRSAPAMRKPRPASIAGTVVSLEELNKHKREQKPPVKNSTPPTSTSAQNTPKRTSNMMSTSLIVTSSSARLSSAEKKTPIKREPVTPKAPTPKPLSKTSSSDRLNRGNSNNNNNSKEKPKDNLPASMTKSTVVAASTAFSSTANSSNNNSVIVAPVDKEKTNQIVVPASVPTQSKDEKNALNAVKTEEVLEPITVNQTAGPQLPKPDISMNEKASPIAADDEKIDLGNEKNETEKQVAPAVVVAVAAPTSVPAPVKPAQNGGSKENSVVRELTPPSSEGNDLMTTSMIAKSKITTEEEAKAALAERRRMARVEAERQAELERQRVETERIAEIKRQEEEAERQRQFEEESTRLAELQRKGEEERLRQAIEEATQREEEERLKREEDERQRVEREEAEKKAKEEADKQRIEVAERLKREEKEREERRKRVEAIMLRTRKAGGGGSATGTPNSTPSKENNESSTQSSTPNDAQQQNAVTTISSENSSTSGSSTTTATTPTPIPAETTTTTTDVAAVVEPQNTQAMYEQSVIDKETALINSFSNMIIDENAKNLQQLPQQPQQQIVEVTNGKLLNVDFANTDALLQNSTTNSTTTTTTVANGNGHIENMNNKNDINILQDVVVPATNQLIDFSIESQDINNAVNFNNNNSLLTTTTNTLVTADSHESKDISLL